MIRLKKSTLSMALVLALALTLTPTQIVEASAIRHGAQIAIYRGPGTWDDGAIAIERMLTWMNITWEEINAWDVNRRDLTQLYKAIWMPGGWADDYKKYIKPPGVNNIRQLVSSGGGYFGICAGAYYAADYTVWEGVRYDYPLKLFKGHADGPIDAIAPWPQYNMTTLNMNVSHPINAYGNSTEVMLYYGGPEFYPYPNQNTDYCVVATWNVTGKPGIISFTYGSGRVLLLGPHPEIEEDSARDGTDFAEELNDYGSDWPFTVAAVKWVLKLDQTLGTSMISRQDNGCRLWIDGQ